MHFSSKQNFKKSSKIQEPDLEISGAFLVTGTEIPTEFREVFSL